MIAVIHTGGKQYIVKEKDVLRVEKLAQEVGADANFEVLMVADEAGADVKIGMPTLLGAVVMGKILEQGRGKKITIQRYKNKTRYRRMLGHRQPFTKIEITKISA